jgi:hypothetical protein
MIITKQQFKYVHAMSLINYEVIVITLLVIHLLLLAGDIELNPGPGGTPDLIESVLETKLDKNTVFKTDPISFTIKQSNSSSVSSNVITHYHMKNSNQ